MGGFGHFKIAFSGPDRFIAAAAGEPGVFAGQTADRRAARRAGVLRELLAWMRDGPAGYAAAASWPGSRNADAVRRSDLAILVECGDEDCST